MQVLTVGDLKYRPDIQYQYTVKIDGGGWSGSPGGSGGSRQLFMWSRNTTRWSHCSHICQGNASLLYSHICYCVKTSLRHHLSLCRGEQLLLALCGTRELIFDDPNGIIEYSNDTGWKRIRGHSRTTWAE